MEVNDKSISFNKHIAIVYSSPNISPLARKLWNILAQQAISKLTDSSHALHLKDLRYMVGYNSYNILPIRNALKELVSSPIEWIKESQGSLKYDQEWATTSFLASAHITKGIITYSFSSFLKENLIEPELYVRLDLECLKKLPTGRSITIYEIAIRFIKKSGYPGTTTKWSLDHFRLLIGAISKTYDQFKFLNNKIIIPCVNAINQHTDIHLTAIFHPINRRTVTHIQFVVTKNTKQPKKGSVPLLSQSTYERLLHHRIHSRQAELLLEKYTELHLTSCIGILERSIAEGDIRNPAAYLYGIVTNETSLLKPKKSTIKQKQLEFTEKPCKKSLEIKKELENINHRLTQVKNYLDKISIDEFESIKSRFLFEHGLVTIALKKPWKARVPDQELLYPLWVKFVEPIIEQSILEV